VVAAQFPPVLPPRPALQRQPRDAGDRRQRFPPKSQGADLLQIVAGEFGGGVPLQRQRHVGRPHAAAVVDHFDAVDPAAAKRDLNPSRAGVDRVLDQLLQRAGRSFHHFTGGDPVDQCVGEAAY
jgi:hypothetical protein